MRSLYALMLMTLLACPLAYGQKKVDLSSDPTLLPYDFKSYQAIALNKPQAIYTPMYLADQDRLGAFEVFDHWHDDTLSCLIFWRDLLKGGAINQVNRDIWAFMDNYGADIDSDGIFEVATSYKQDDKVWLEIVEVGGNVQYKRDLSEIIDRKDINNWDGNVKFESLHDINGDLSKDFLCRIFTGYALYPRSIFCLDLKNDTILWNYPISGHPHEPEIIEDKQNGKMRIYLDFASMGNNVTAGDLDDSHSYLICLNEKGEREWLKVLGGIFSQVNVCFLNVDEDGSGVIITATNLSEDDLQADSSLPLSIIRTFDLQGNLLKTLKLDPDISTRQLQKVDLDKDGEEEVLLIDSDGKLTVFDQDLNAKSQYLFKQGIRVWKCMDFLGNGKNQIILATDEDELVLLNDKFRMLAKYDFKFREHDSHVVETELSDAGKTLLLKAEGQPRMAVLYFEKKPFFAILKGFVLRYQQTLFAVLGILVVALVFTNYHRRRTKRNLDIISNQRDELEKTKAELESTLENLKAAQIRLVQSEKMASLSMLVAGIAHEVNNAIGALISDNSTVTRATGKLRQQFKNSANLAGDAEKLIGIIEAMQASSLAVGESAERVSRIVRRLRSFARLDEAELQRVDLNQCIDETLELLHPQLKQNILINKDYGELKPITCYPSQLNQVFLNLILNARDSIDGRGEINIETQQENGYAIIAISDTGKGISEENLKRIFDPGFTTKGVGVGTGLGLAICYQIVQDHQGEIDIESEPGEGTMVRLRLPFELD
ncbi:MAG: hypothetical protein GF310_14565 [candidate division Zixibacteria bacterium]|nr:hypothetical protein [candidate division Zixibacteria bacterium]